MPSCTSWPSPTSRHPPLYRRLRPHQFEHTAALRPQARRPIRCCRLPRCRRQPPARGAPSRRRPDLTGTHGRHRQNHRRGSRAGRRDRPVRKSSTPSHRHQAHRRARHPQRQSRARRLRHQGRRTQSPRASRPCARLRLRAGCLPRRRGREIKPNDVIVIRYEGPKGGPGMREMLQVTAAIAGIPELSGNRRPPHRWPLLRSHPRPHGRPRRAGSSSRRPHRCRPRRRHHPLRYSRTASSQSKSPTRSCRND